MATIFIPKTNQMRHDVLELNRAIVIDVRLRPTHSTNVLQSVMMATRKLDYLLPITHMKGPQYLLILPKGNDRHCFILEFGKPL